MIAPNLKTSLVLAGLMAAGGASAQENSPTQTPEQKFAAWKLQATTGVPNAQALAELEELLESVEAKGGSPQLLASLTDSAVKLRARLTPKPAKVGRGQVSAAAEKEVLRLALEKAIVDHDVSFIDSLGIRAVPALKEMAADWDGVPTSGEKQPALYWLARASAPDGLDVALQLMSSKSFLLKRRTLRTLETQKTFREDDVWRPEGETDWRLVRPEWEQILHLALQDPAVEPNALRPLFGAFIEKGQLPRSLGDLAHRMSVRFSSEDVIPSEGLWYLDGAATSVSEEVRERAALFVPMHDDQLALQLSKDPAYPVRRTLAQKILCDEVLRNADRKQGITRSEPIAVPVTATILEVFVALAADDHPKVRRDLRDAVTRYLDWFNAAPFSSQMLEELLPQVHDREIRGVLAYSIQHLPEEERFSAVEALVNSLANSESETHFDDIYLNPSRFGLSPKDDFFRLLDLWHAKGFFERKGRDPHPFEALVLPVMNDLVEDAGLDPEPFIERAQSWGFLDSLAPRSSGRGKVLYHWVQALSDQARARIVRIIHADAQSPADDELIEGCAKSIENHFIRSYDVLTELLQDETAPRGAQLWATRALLREHFDSVDTQLIKVMAGIVAASGSASESRIVHGQLWGEKGEEFLRLLAAEPQAAPEQFLGVRTGSLSPATLNAIWPRVATASWTEMEDPAYAIFAITSGLARDSSERLDPRLDQVDFSIRRACEGLLFAARTSKHPSLLPFVAELMKRPDFTHDGLWKEAALALGAYMNDEAAAILLEAARWAPSANTRGYAMKALEEITQWREAAAAWQKSSSASEKRSHAIAELIEILDDGAQPVASHAAAIRGLGLLDAVEELPRIVRALSSKQTAIQEAARAAMTRMEK